jgi:hypothetical protein
MSLVVSTEESSDDLQGLTHGSKLLTLSVGKVGECALDVPGSICSINKTVSDMRDFLKDRNVDQTKITSKESTLSEMKKQTQCLTERCVLTNQSFQEFADSKAIADSKGNLKPLGPSNNTALLNNSNIDTVLNKLTKIHKNYYHMNFQMIDFAGVKDGSGWAIKKGERITPTELGNINMLDVIKKGFKTFGVVLNTDVRTGGGIHWFALFCDFRQSPYTVEYFNSSGNKPVYQIQNWIHKTVAQINTKHKCIALQLSGVVHQTGSETECGPYSLYYIWNRLNGKPAINFQQKAIPDCKMIEFRKMLFA